MINSCSGCVTGQSFYKKYPTYTYKHSIEVFCLLIYSLIEHSLKPSELLKLTKSLKCEFFSSVNINAYTHL